MAQIIAVIITVKAKELGFYTHLNELLNYSLTVSVYVKKY